MDDYRVYNNLDLTGRSLKNISKIENVSNGDIANIYGEDAVGNLVKGEFVAGTQLILKSQSDLECDYSDCNFIKAIIEEDEHISVSEMEDFKVYGLLIHNVSDETITITMPELDAKNRDEVEIPAGHFVEFSFFADGIRAYWQISEELV